MVKFIEILQCSSTGLILGQARINILKDSLNIKYSMELLILVDFLFASNLINSKDIQNWLLYYEVEFWKEFRIH
ncbi:unnamed protein product [Paramecium octaurelia]|uniref:Uncharacterized protein n=1 Tax=Paramecium octaurelia TaxID=43137 RepID=A0A8S1WE11_PAROT|nr:unnamed protein product [Paramecium octaurelia]